MTSVLRRGWRAQALCARPAGWTPGLRCGGRLTLHFSLPWQECLSRLLSPCGPVQSVKLQEKPELAESPKEPQSKFFHPKPVPVSLQDLAAAVRACAGPSGVPGL